jgi:malonate transporter
MQDIIVIFGVILIGFISKKKKLFSDEQINGFEMFLFKIAMPCFLFYHTASCSIDTILNAKYIYAYLISFSIVALFTAILIINNNTSEIYIKILASSYVNSAIYVTPFIAILLDNPIAGIIGNLLQVICIQTPFIIILSLLKDDNKSLSSKIYKILCTPIIIMPIIGLLINYLNFSQYITYFIMLTNEIGNICLNFSLFVFGLMLGGVNIGNDVKSKEIMTLVIIKNILHPFVAYIIGRYVLLLEGYWLNALVIAKSAPTALSIYLISKNYTIKEDVIKGVVSLTSIGSLISIIFIYLLLL